MCAMGFLDPKKRAIMMQLVIAKDIGKVISLKYSLAGTLAKKSSNTVTTEKIMIGTGGEGADTEMRIADKAKHNFVMGLDL